MGIRKTQYRRPELTLEEVPAMDDLIPCLLPGERVEMRMGVAVTADLDPQRCQLSQLRPKEHGIVERSSDGDARPAPQEPARHVDRSGKAALKKGRESYVREIQEAVVE